MGKAPGREALRKKAECGHIRGISAAYQLSTACLGCQAKLPLPSLKTACCTSRVYTRQQTLKSSKVYARRWIILDF